MSEKERTIKNFKSIVVFIKDMINKKNIRMVMPSETSVRFYVLNDEEITKFSKRKKISINYILYTLEIEIPKYIVQLLNNAPYEFSINGKVPTEEEKEENKNKSKIVSDLLVDSKVKNMHLIKSSTKIKTLHSIDWEINKKIFDDTKGNIPELKFATLKFNLSGPSNENNLLMKLFSFNGINSSECIDCDLSDIEMLIDILNDIKKAIEEEEGAKQ